MAVIEKLSTQTPYMSICRNPYSSGVFREEINGSLATIIEKNDAQEIIVFKKMFLNLQGKEESSGYCLVQCIDGTCNIEVVKEFRGKLEEITKKRTGGSYMAVDPVLIAKAFPKDVLAFVDNYNNFQKRKPIRLYTFE